MVAMQFQMVQELVRTAQGIERVMNDTPRSTSEQSDHKIQKKRFHTSYIEESSFEERKEGSVVHGGSSRGVR